MIAPRILEREPPTRAFAGGLLLVIAAFHVDFAQGAVASTTITWFHWLWPYVFGAAAVACTIAAVSFTPRWVAMSGGLTVVSYSARACVIVMGELAGRTHLGTRTVAFGAGVWILVAVIAGALWLRAYGPLANLWVRRERAGR